MPVIDEGEASRRCPVCGEQNNCGLLNQNGNQQCWCVDVNPADGILDSLPQEVRGKVCLCRRCLDSASVAEG
ncbi:MAG TPA: hypothetical protein DCF45_08730 [Gammaproteobacteria bacterium]|nr:hypothetical protein [Gammaproteobacteria bacterium]